MVSSISTTKLGVAALALFTGAALCLLALAFDAPPADATTFNVPCSGANDLIDAIEAANTNSPGPDTIELAADCTYTLSSVYQQDTSQPGLPTNYAYWYGPSGLPAIASEITVEGNGATIMRSSIPGIPPFRLLFVGADPTDPDTFGYASPGPGDLTLRNLTLRGGLGQGGDAIVGGGGGAGMGGAIFNQGKVQLERVTITNSNALGGNGGSASGVGPGGGIGSDAGSSANSSGGGFGVGFVGFGGGDGGVNSGGGGGFRAIDDGEAGVAPLAGGNGGGPATGLGGRGGAAAGTPGMGGNGAGGGTPTSENGGNGGDFGRGGVEGAGGGVGGGGATLDNGSGGGFGGGGGGANGGGGNGGFGGGGGNGSSIGIGGFGGGDGALISSSAGGGGGAGMGGAIFNHQGELTLLNSTLSGNTAVGGPGGPAADAGRGLGGAIFNLNGAVRIDYSTIAYNTAEDGGALYNLGYLADDAGDPDGHTYSAHVVATGSIISPAVFSNAPETLVDGLQNTVGDPGDTKIDLMASNLNETFATAGRGEIATGPNTLVANPELGLLAYNGGPTQTHALQLDSPAIDKVNSSGGPTTDQRGVSRPQGAASDIGSFELEVTDNTAPTVTSTVPLNGTRDALKTANLTAGFSEEVHNVDTTTFTLERKKGSAYVPVAATVTPVGGTVEQGGLATLNPTQDLTKGQYRATITNGVTDTAGNALSAPYTWTFKVVSR